MHFTKMHGTGNDFILLEDMEQSISPSSYSALALSLCKRRLSIGADGLMILTPPKNGGDFFMHFYNSDGSEGEMCGNGARCACRYGFDHGLSPCRRILIETKSGTVAGYRSKKSLYTVRLNEPSVFLPDITVRAPFHTGPGLCAGSWPRLCRCSYLELGRPGLPHAIVRLPGLMPSRDMADASLAAFAKALRFSPDFPKGANINFFDLMPDRTVRLLTYERGVEDFTLACGTGTGCTAAVLAVKGMTDAGSTDFYMPGGKMSVSLTLEPAKSGRPFVSNLMLTGPAAVTAEGEIGEVMPLTYSSAAFLS